MSEAATSAERIGDLFCRLLDGTQFLTLFWDGEYWHMTRTDRENQRVADVQRERPLELLQVALEKEESKFCEGCCCVRPRSDYYARRQSKSGALSDVCKFCARAESKRQRQ